MLFLALAALAFTTGPALAAGDVEAGHAIARRWCTACHDSSDAVPSLREAVNRPDQNGGVLEAWLTAPHPAMPDLSLSRREIDDLVAYLGTLQEDR